MKYMITMLLAGLLVALPIAAAAQTTGALTTSTPPSSEAQPWYASGFLGSNFANNADPASLSYGGSVGYLWKNKFGAEADLGFSPSFQLQNNFFGLGVKPTVNTYMANAVGAIPVGSEGRFRPFISGGIGGISLRSGISGTDAANAIGATFGVDPAIYSSSANETRFGGNIGGGLMGFAGHWGFKADIRYFRATGSYNTGSSSASNNNTNPNGTPTPTGPLPPGYFGPMGGRVTGTPTGTTLDTAPTDMSNITPGSISVAGAALSGLHFWRANVGVAVRF